MSEIRVEYERAWDSGKTGGAVREILVYGHPGPIGEAELYAIKVALEKQVQLNAEVERLRQRKQYRPKESWVAKFPVTAAQ